MFFKENATLAVSNPILKDVSQPITEALISDIKVKEVRAIYPLVKAINSGRLTRNFTYYPAESLIGKGKADDPTGYASFVKPYGKPVLREHQAQKVMGMMGPIEDADIPMGRIVFAGFRRRQEKKDGPGTMPSKKFIPGTVEGDGTLLAVPAITDPEAIVKVLGGAYQTVSIGSRVDNVWESISGKNIAELRRKGEEMPSFERGQLYEGKLSYWRMGEVRGVELSFVNVPSDEYAGVVDPDIGEEGIRLLVAEKKSGKRNEFNFFDAKTSERVELSKDEFLCDESFFEDSVSVGNNIWFLNDKADVTESAELEDEITEAKVGDMVSWNSSGGRATGKITKIVRDGKIKVPGSSFTINGTPDDPAALIRLYRDGKPTDRYVGHKVSTLRSGSKESEDSDSEDGMEEIEIGDMVEWTANGDSGTGMVEHIMREGTLGAPGGKYSIAATPEDPAVLVRIYEEEDPTDRFVGAKMKDVKLLEMEEEDDDEEDDDEEESLDLSSLTEAERSMVPPTGVRNACKRGLKLHEEGKSGSGLEGATVREAKSMAAGESQTEAKIRKGYRFWARNQRFLREPKDSPAYVSALLWGGSPGVSWFTKMYNSLESKESLNLPEQDKEINMPQDINLTEASVAELIEYSKEENASIEMLLETFTTSADVTDLVEGKNGENIENAELFAEISEFATTLCGDWNESAAKFAVSLYLNKGGTLKEPLVENENENDLLTFGSLYLLNEEDEEYSKEAKLTTAARKALPDSVFCGPNRSFPVNDRAHAIAALRLIGRYKGPDKEKTRACIERKAKKFGVGNQESALVLHPLLVEVSEGNYVPLFTIRSAEEINEFIDNLPIFSECYGLTDVQKESFAETLSKAGDLFTDVYPESDYTPCVLSMENLVHYVVNSEKVDSRKELVMLAGLVRKGKVTKEDLDDAHESYDVFGSAILRKFVESAPGIKPVENTPAEEAETQPNDLPSSVETISDPVAAIEVEETKKNQKESKDAWFGYRVKPTKRNSNNPVKNKEKS